MKGKYIDNKIKKEVQNEFDVIQTHEFIMWDWVFNRWCVDNSADTYHKEKDTLIIMCMCIDEWGDTWLHMINKQWDKYIDNTLGYRYKNIEYYYVKEVPEHVCDNHAKLWNYFNNYRNHLVNKHKHFLDPRKITWSDLI